MGMLADELAAVLIGIHASLVCHLVNEAFHVEVVLVEVYRTPVADRHVRDAQGILHENVLDVVRHLVEKALLHMPVDAILDGVQRTVLGSMDLRAARATQWACPRRRDRRSSWPSSRAGRSRAVCLPHGSRALSLVPRPPWPRAPHK